MFQFLLGVLLFAANFLGVSRASAEMGAGAGRGVMTMPIRGRARWAALTLALALVPTGVGAQTPITEFNIPTASSSPQYITAGPDGALWFIEQDGNKIGRITTAGAIKEFPIRTSNSQPRDITAGPDGALWFTEYGPNGNKIGRITTAGVITEFPIPTFDSRPFGITTGPDGALWFTEGTANKIGRITTAGVITEFPPIPTSNSQPYGIAAGPDGALWFAEHFGQKIGRITTAGVITEFPLPTGGSFPLDIAVGLDGALWFTEVTGNKIGRITTAGVITEFPIPTSSVLGSHGITAGPDGALWFTENGGNKIGRITTAGVITEFPIPTSNSLPIGITAGPDGALWFTENGGNKIGRITGASAFLSFPIPKAPTVRETLSRCLRNSTCTAHNANITSVMDHTGTPLDPNPRTRQGQWYQENSVPIADRAVTAYTGETGKWTNGRDDNKASGYKNDSGTNFVINGNYVGAKSDAKNCGVGVLDCPCKATSSCAPTFLNYDGHSGYDYPFSGANTTGQGGTPIVAPATGQLYRATDDLVNISIACDRAKIKGWDRWHSFFIVHGRGTSDTDFVPNGRSSWYLHADRLDPTIDAAIRANGHAFVRRNTPIAYVGCYGPTTTSTTCTKTLLHMCGTGLTSHLHFEVRKTHFNVNRKPDSLDTQVIDPYSDGLWLR